MQKHRINKRYLAIGLWIFLLLFAVIWSSCIFLSKDKWEKIEVDWTDDVPEGTQMWIDYVKPSGKSIMIEGYAFVHGEDLSVVKYEVVLHDETEDAYYAIGTSVCNRGDLTAYFNEGFSYDEGRFMARVSRSHLDPTHEYTVNLLYRCNGYNTLLPTRERITRDAILSK